MKPAVCGDSFSCRAVDGDEGTHQDITLPDSKHNDESFPPMNNRSSSSFEGTPLKSDKSSVDGFNFDNFINSSQFALALEILKYFQAEKLPSKPSLLDKKQRNKLKSVTVKYIPETPVTSEESDATNILDVDTEYYKLPPPRVVRKDQSVTKDDLSDVRADEIIQKLIDKIQSRMKHKKCKPSRNHHQYDTTSDSSMVPSENQTLIKVVQSKPSHKRKKHVVYPTTTDEDITPQTHRYNKKKEVTKIYIKDQGVQTESTSTSQETVVPDKNGTEEDTEVPMSSSQVSNLTETLSKTHIIPGDEVEVDEVPEVIEDKSEEPATQNKFLYKNRCNLAWYEPIGIPRPPYTKFACLKAESLQDMLIASKPGFVSRLEERQRLLSIMAEERKLQAVWQADREKLFGKTLKRERRTVSSAPFPTSRAPPPPLKKRPPMKMKEMKKFSRDRYLSLPEVKEKKLATKRKQQYAANRENQRRFNKKVQNQVLSKISQNF